MAKGGGERKKVKGSLKWECGMRNSERKKKIERIKVGIRKVNED
jgi:hypothetical protein